MNLRHHYSIPLLKKSKGQNFLVDKNILRKIITVSDIKPDDIVLEIGAGIGNLTCMILEKAKYVFANEVDKRLLPILCDNLSSFTNVEIIPDDFLKIDFNKLFEKIFPHKIKIIANIPYNISTPIVSRIFENKKFFNIAILTLQKEFAERLVAKPSTKNYGRLSLFAEFHSCAKILFNIKKTSFFPQPKVASSVVKLELKDKFSQDVKDEKLFFEVIEKSFQHRRKTLKNILLYFLDKNKVEEILFACKISPQARPETLTIHHYISLSNAISKYNF